MWKVAAFVVALSSIFVVIQAQDFCIQCTSSQTQLTCIGEESVQHNMTCLQPRNGTCFSRVDDNGNVHRGCLHILEALNINATQCDSEACALCTGPGCNDAIFPPHRLWCHQCTGTIESDCANQTATVMSVCPTFRPDDRCYIARPDGNYERGCMSSATNRCHGDTLCTICPGNGCNNHEYSGTINLTTNSAARMVPFVVISAMLAFLNK